MFQFDIPKGKSSILKVVGVGGGGGNAVNYMFSQSIEGVDFIICNTDSQALETSNIPNKIQLGPNLTQGLGAGANPMIGKEATEESMEEIKQILEVNTKMAFITAGMGGGTGTGGAPIIAEVCKELGILTVGIVTTPFSYEGLKRKKQANEGIKEMKKHVDTLLVISNDKLRQQFGNLTMSQAFSKADNVLATAAKCITDVINSTGQINVDFADVSTVMRDGGVAILGNAVCAGEDRAQQAIEEAVNSPLLNDNDISGARWILININSGRGEHEFTMDEVDIIQSYLLSKAGEGTDVIMGLGYDDNLGDKIGITLIATGFEDSDTKEENARKNPVKEKPKKEVLKLEMDKKEESQKKAASQPMFLFDQNEISSSQTQAEEKPVVEKKDGLCEEQVMASLENQKEKEIEEDLMPKITTIEEDEEEKELNDILFDRSPAEEPVAENIKKDIVYLNLDDTPEPKVNISSPTRTGSSIEMDRGINSYVYVERVQAPVPDPAPIPKPIPKPIINEIKETNFLPETNDAEELKALEEMKLIERRAPVITNGEAGRESQVRNNPLPMEEELDEAEIDRRRMMERISKLRNISFNSGPTELNDEYDKVPAYMRRNVDLCNSIASVESFYKNYTVDQDEKGNIEINTSNSFLDGKNPD